MMKLSKLFQHYSRHVNVGKGQRIPRLSCINHTQAAQQNPTTLKKAVNAIGAQKFNNHEQLNNNHSDPNNCREHGEGTYTPGAEEPGELITLRPYELSDIDDFMEWDIDGAGATTWFHSLRCRPESREDGLYYLKCQRNDPELYLDGYGYYTCAICIRNRPVGEISLLTDGLTDLDEEEDPDSEISWRTVAQIGYMLARQWRGRGVATRAVKIAAAEAFEKCPKLKELRAFVDEDDVWAQRVAERAGFTRDDDGHFKLLRPADPQPTTQSRRTPMEKARDDQEDSEDATHMRQASH